MNLSFGFLLAVLVPLSAVAKRRIKATGGSPASPSSGTAVRQQRTLDVIQECDRGIESEVLSLSTLEGRFDDLLRDMLWCAHERAYFRTVSSKVYPVMQKTLRQLTAVPIFCSVMTVAGRMTIRH